MKFVTLLCCINPSEPSAVINELTFFSLISPVAPIRNIKLISTYGQCKAFIQVENENIAQRIVRELNHKTLAIGRLKVFLSHKKYVAFDKPLTSVLADAAKSTPGRKLSPGLDGQGLSDIMGSSDYQPNFDEYFGDDYIQFNLNGQKNDFLRQTETPRKQHLGSNSDFISRKNSNQLAALGKQDSGETMATKYLKTQYKPRDVNLSLCKTVRIDNVRADRISCQMILNLFGCFGNILNLFFIQNEKVVLLEFEQHKHARRVMDSANLAVYFGNSMVVDLYNDSQTISYLQSIPSDEIKYVKGNFKFYRFKDLEKKPTKALQTTLHITNVSANMDIESLCVVISQLHQPTKMLQGKFNGSTSDSFIIEFADLCQSLEVLSLLHNRKVEGRKFNVEFIDTELTNFSMCS